jgi:hypothetical protein
MLTLNQVKEYLIQFFNGHKQINTVVFANNFNFSAKADVLYRVAHIENIDPATVNNNEIIYKFKIAIGDIEDPNNQDSENEIWSDCIQIANDFITYFGNDDFEDFFIDKNITIQKFSEGNTDRVAGVVFAFGVRQERLNNPCTLPMINPFTGITFTGNIVYPNGYYNLLQPYLTILSASSLYQPIGNYLTGATIDLTDYYTKVQSNNLFLTGFTVDFSDYYTKEQSDSKYLTGFTVDLSGYQVKGNYVSAATLSQYQLLGNYVSASTLSQYVLLSGLTNYYTKSQSDSKYLTGYTLTATTLAGYGISSGDTLFDGKYLNISASTLFQPVITLTTSGASGSATLGGGYLNIPQYSGNTYSGGTPSALVGLSAITGSASTFIRSDAAPAINQTITPVWTGLHSYKNNLTGTSVTAAVSIENDTVATSATTQQNSAALRLRAYNYPSNSSQSNDFYIYNKVFSFGGYLCFANSVNGANASDVFNVDQFGNMAILNNGSFNVQKLSIGNSSADGVIIANLSSANSSNQIQNSGRIRLQGNVWVSGANNQVDWIQEARVVSGTTPTTSLYFASRISVNGSGAFTDRMSISSNGSLQVNKVLILTGSNASAGVSSLTSGTVTVSTTSITSNSIVMLNYNSTSGTIGVLVKGTVINGTSFVINSLQAGTTGSVNTADTSSVSWIIVN